MFAAPRAVRSKSRAVDRPRSWMKSGVGAAGRRCRGPRPGPAGDRPGRGARMGGAATPTGRRAHGRRVRDHRLPGRPPGPGRPRRPDQPTHPAPEPRLPAALPRRALRGPLPGLEGDDRRGRRVHPGWGAAQPRVQPAVPAGDHQGLGLPPVRPRRQRVPGLPAGRRPDRPGFEPARGARAGDRAAHRLRPVHGPVPRVRAEAGPADRRAHAGGPDVPDARVGHRGVHGGHPGGTAGHRQVQRREDGRGVPRLVRPAGVRAADPRHPPPRGARRAQARLPAHAGVLPRRPRRPGADPAPEPGPGRDRRGAHRAGRSGERHPAAAARLQCRGPRAVRPVRRPADLRRGGHRLPDRDLRRPGVLRGRAGPDRVRQGRGRRLPVGRWAGWQARVHEVPVGRARGGVEEGPRGRHPGGQPAVVGRGVLHDRRARAAAGMRACRRPG